MAAAARAKRPPSKSPGRFESFARSYTAGLDSQGVRRLFGKDASQVYAVLARDQPADPVTRNRIRLFWHRAKVVLLGLSYKLSPPRRLLFALAMLFAAMGVVSGDVSSGSSGDGKDRGGIAVRVDFSPAWFLLSIGSLGYLLAMELVDRVLVRDELEVARGVQRELMPRQAPPLPGWRFAHSYRTANEVGGDYYDFLPVAGDRLAVVIGDASGHGMAAGLVMAVAAATLRTVIEIDPSPAAVARLLNRALHRAGQRRNFMTLFYALLEPQSGRLDYVCAGHPYPLLVRAGGAVEELGSGALPLGVRPEVELRCATLDMGPGDRLVLYSDGLPEAMSGPAASATAFGFERLRALAVEPGEAQVVHDRILAAFARHVGAEPLGDDLSLVVLERTTS